MSKKNLSKQIFVEAKELEAQGVSFTALHTALEIECFNKVFARVSILAKNYREKAITICEEYLEAGLEAFITESRSFFSVWKVKPKEVIKTTENSFNIKALNTEAKTTNQESAKIITITHLLATDSVSESKPVVLSTVQEMIAFLEQEVPGEIERGKTNEQESQWWHSYIAG